MGVSFTIIINYETNFLPIIKYVKFKKYLKQYFKNIQNVCKCNFNSIFTR